ncbi:MAG: c-type cytochrome [Nitrospinae bacterium]|nr:c-type cytochrome [Nitrospinota bacterium]
MFRIGFIRLLAGLFLFYGAPALGNGVDRENNFQISQIAEKGQKLFLHYCAHCHGAKGDGDGYNSEYMDKEPSELSDHTFIAKKSNKQIFKVINLGGVGVKKSSMMPVFGNTLSGEQIWQLVAFIRYLAEDDSHPVIVPEEASKESPAQRPFDYQIIKTFSEWYSKNGKNKETLDWGQKLFFKKKSCLACHQIEDEGGRVGPDLSRAGFLYKPEWLYSWLMNPQHFKPQSKMPNLGLGVEEDQAITAYLASLPAEPIEAPEEWRGYLSKKGNSEKGKELFNNPEGKAFCAKCHRVNKEGGEVGPDLSYVGISRSLPFILESILEPKKVITVGYASVLILTKEGKFLTGVKVNEDDSAIDILDKEGTLLHVPKDKIKKYKTQKISIMPGNFKEILSVEEIQDLMAYLETLTIPQLEKLSID